MDGRADLRPRKLCTYRRTGGFPGLGELAKEVVYVLTVVGTTWTVRNICNVTEVMLQKFVVRRSQKMCIVASRTTFSPLDYLAQLLAQV